MLFRNKTYLNRFHGCRYPVWGKQGHKNSILRKSLSTPLTPITQTTSSIAYPINLLSDVHS